MPSADGRLCTANPDESLVSKYAVTLSRSSSIRPAISPSPSHLPELHLTPPSPLAQYSSLPPTRPPLASSVSLHQPARRLQAAAAFAPAAVSRGRPIVRCAIPDHDLPPAIRALVPWNVLADLYLLWPWPHTHGMCGSDIPKG